MSEMRSEDNNANKKKKRGSPEVYRESDTDPVSGQKSDRIILMQPYEDSRGNVTYEKTELK